VRAKKIHDAKHMLVEYKYEEYLDAIDELNKMKDDFVENMREWNENKRIHATYVIGRKEAGIEQMEIAFQTVNL
jgi:hypothetical protein